MRWHGPPTARAAAVADLLGALGGPAVLIEPAEPPSRAELELENVDAERVVGWALEHARDVEVLGPTWLRNRVAEALAARVLG